MPDASRDDSFAMPQHEGEFLKDMREEYTADVAADRGNCEAAATDLRFLAGRPWDDDVLALRAGRPSLNVNRMPQFVRQVTGDIRLNKPAIKVSPVESADDDDAAVIEGLVRHIEYRSKASRVYASVADSQVACGMGHMRLTVEWPEDGFEPELMISGIRNPFAVKWDSAAQRPDRSDAGHCFVETSMPRKAFEKVYPDAIPGGWMTSTPRGLSGWIGTDKVRIVEYWRVIKRPVTLFLLNNGTVIDDTDGDSLRMAAEQVGIIRERKSTKSQVVQYLTNGQTLLQEPYLWPGSRIPIITAWGEEIVMGEETVRTGLIRNAQDPQYLTNYLWSAAVEAIGLQPKPKWVASDKAIAGREDEWANANTSTDSTLVYKDGQTPPTFNKPPDFPAAFMNMARAAEDAMKATTGIYDAALGQTSNETSGRAIQARDRQGDVSTYVYPDNLVAAIENLADQIVEMIPTVYDAPRQVRILGEDMKPQVIKVNQERGLGPDGQPQKKVDLTTGKYDVIVQTGPGFTTRRQEASEAMMEFARIFPAAAPILMDLVAKNQDWPDRDDFIQRLQALIPKPQQAPPPTLPNPKDLASAEKTAAETTGQKLKNISDAMALGLDPSMLMPPAPAAPQSPVEGEAPVPSIGQMNGPMGQRAPGAIPG